MLEKPYHNIIGEGPDLVLLHGWGFHSGVWQDLVQRLSASFRITLIDLPGFGQSLPYQGDYDFTTIAESILRVAPDNAHYIAWSLGGLFATHIAHTYPERVNRLMTVASSPCFIEKQDWPGMQPNVLQRFTDDLVSDYKNTLQRFLALQFLHCEQAKPIVQQLKKQLFCHGEPAIDALVGGLKLLESIDLRHILSALHCDNMHILGGLDALVPRRVITPLKETLNAQSKVVLIDKAGHVPFLTHAALFTTLVTDFLNE